MRLTILAILTVCSVGLLRPPAHAATENFVLYFPSGHQLVPFASSGGARYIPVIQVLNLVGKVEGIQEKKNSLRIFFESTQIEMRTEDKKVEVGKAEYVLSQPVYLVGGKWMVPVDFLTSILPPITHQAVQYQEGTNRIFIGDVKPSSFTVRLALLPNGARLILQFTDKVSVHTASSNGKWIIFLGDHPMEPMESVYHFQNPYVSTLEFDDDDGLPKLILSPAAVGLNLNPELADDNKVLMADVLKGPVAAVQAPTGPSPAPPTQPAPPATGQPTSPAPSLPLPVVVLDPGHGGSDNGGHSNDGVLEKDLMVQFVSRAQAALLATSKYRVVLTRTGDMNVSDEQRAQAANQSSAIYFLSFHAGDLGTASPRIAIFTFQPPSTQDSNQPSSAGPGATNDAPKKSSLFVPWSQVQESRLPQSQQLAQALDQQLSQLRGVDVILPEGAPLHTLRSVNAPAAAIEIGRLAPDAPGLALTDSAFQQQVAAAIVRALASFEKGGN